jgi:NADP-dependent 3-hydroxy acid dehydrogenase YdfG
MKNSKIALITGATSGIGKATAQAFAKEGIKLILCGRRVEKLQETKNSLEKLVPVYTLNFDVSIYEDVRVALQSLPAEWQNIDILINNAGNAHGLGPIHDSDLADWQKMIDSNVIGLLNVSKIICQGMVHRKSGHIVNISSVAGKQTYENGAVYCATKKSVEAISEGMRLDLTKHNIKITNIAPGAVETEFSLVRFKGDAAKAAKVYEGFTPLSPEDIADTIRYAVSAPAHVTIADMTIYAAKQAAPTLIYRDI